MSEWKISPSDGVSIVPNSTGATVAFEPNRPTTVYEITYTADNGCILKTTIKLRENCGGECSINGTMNSTKLPATIDSQSYQIGTYWTDCGSEINIMHNEGIKFYDISASDGKIYGRTIDANPSTDGRSSSFFLEVNGVKSNELWVSQNGKEGPVDPCDVIDDNPDLNNYIIPFNQAIGVAINATDTKCTYSYLSYVYENISNDIKSSDTSAYTVSWALANTMAEITPYDRDIVTSYFEKSAERFGGTPDINNGEAIYSGRTLGGFEYAKIKRGDYSGTNEMADLARKELSRLGIGDGEMISVPTFDSSSPFVKLSELIPSDLPSSGKNSVDYNITQKEINDHPTGTTQAIADKNSNDDYLCDNVFGVTYDSAHSNFLSYGSSFTSASNGYVKWDWDYERWRPGAYQKIVTSNDKFNVPSGVDVYLASAKPDGSRSKEQDDIIYTSACGACGGCNGECDGDSRCNSTTCIGDYDCSQDCTRARQLGIGDRCPSQGMNSHQSYPSGHSCKAFFQFLMCVESDGISSQYGRTLDYCYNRVVVRAHWYSDIIAGKYNAASQIGFMNGVRQFHELMP